MDKEMLYQLTGVRWDYCFGLYWCDLLSEKGVRVCVEWLKECSSFHIYVRRKEEIVAYGYYQTLAKSLAFAATCDDVRISWPWWGGGAEVTTC